MRSARTKFLGSVLAFLGVFGLLVGSALAAGSITYTRKEVQESNGGWHLTMTIVYGGKPNTAHVPMRFAFTPTAIYENYLDDQHVVKAREDIFQTGRQGVHMFDVQRGDTIAGAASAVHGFADGSLS